MSDSEPKVKVTDKRMFTPDGELREDFRHLESAAEAAATVGDEQAAPPAPGPAPTASGPAPSASGPAPSASGPAAAGRAPDAAAAPDPTRAASWSAGRLPERPGFLDLLGSLAEPVALFLGDAQLPDGRSTEDLEAARFHIDLLEVVQQKTAGNLSAEESALLEDLLYRLRLRYVQKTS